MSDSQISVLGERYRNSTAIAITEFSTVYAAFDRARGREVIVKAARQGRCDEEDHCLSCWILAHEGVVLRRLAQRGIPAPRYLEQFHIAGRPFLAMTRIAGQDLEQLRREERLSPREAARLIIEVCTAVAQLHQAGYVHQDIKPANIVVRPNGAAVLIDWGSAERIRAPGDRRPYSCFTHGFVSPEQVRGEARPCNDIFSLGRTLGALAPWPSRRLEEIIQRATASAGRRYEHVAELQRDLVRLVALDALTGFFDLAAL